MRCVAPAGPHGPQPAATPPRPDSLPFAGWPLGACRPLDPHRPPHKHLLVEDSARLDSIAQAGERRPPRQSMASLERGLASRASRGRRAARGATQPDAVLSRAQMGPRRASQPAGSDTPVRPVPSRAAIGWPRAAPPRGGQGVGALAGQASHEASRSPSQSTAEGASGAQWEDRTYIPTRPVRTGVR